MFTMLSLSQIGRSRALRLGLCVLLLFCVVTIVLVPGTNIPPTTVRAVRAASCLLMQLAVLALGFALRFDTSPLQYDLLSSFNLATHPSPSRLFLTRVLLC